jgi:hypothetical protein
VMAEAETCTNAGVEPLVRDSVIPPSMAVIVTFGLPRYSCGAVLVAENDGNVAIRN